MSRSIMICHLFYDHLIICRHQLLSSFTNIIDYHHLSSLNSLSFSHFVIHISSILSFHPTLSMPKNLPPKKKNLESPRDFAFDTAGVVLYPTRRCRASVSNGKHRGNHGESQRENPWVHISTGKFGGTVWKLLPTSSCSFPKKKPFPFFVWELHVVVVFCFGVCFFGWG